MERDDGIPDSCIASDAAAVWRREDICVTYSWMSNTLTIRLTDEEEAWLRATAKKLRTTRSAIVHEQLRLARSPQRFGHLVGYIQDATPDLSARKGFSRR